VTFLTNTLEFVGLFIGAGIDKIAEIAWAEIEIASG